MSMASSVAIFAADDDIDVWEVAESDDDDVISTVGLRYQTIDPVTREVRRIERSARDFELPGGAGSTLESEE